jgi:hypothetical protein
MCETIHHGGTKAQRITEISVKLSAPCLRGSKNFQ